MKNLAFALLASLLSLGCAAETETEIEDLATDAELVNDVFETTRSYELETMALSATQQRTRAQNHLVDLGVITDGERAALISVFTGERTPAELVDFVQSNLTDASPVMAVLAGAMKDASSGNLAGQRVIAIGLRSAARGAQAGFAAGGNRGARFGALIAASDALVKALTN